MKKVWIMLFVLVLGAVLAGCGKEEASSNEDSTKVDVSRVRVLIGSSSTGGDTYQNADAVTRYLEKELDTNAKVDAVGANRAFDELAKAKTDGSSVMFFHDMAYLGVEYGSFDEKYSLENWTVGPVVALNPGNAFLAKADAPFDTMAESAEWLKSNPDKTLKVAIEAGGVSQIGFDAYYLWVKEEYGTEVSDRIKVYVTGSQSDKDQALWDGNVDIIHGSVSSNAQYTEEGVEDKIKMKFVGITSSKRLEGYEIPTFAEQGIKVDGKEFTFDKEYFFLLPKEIDQAFVDKLDQAIAEVVKNPDYSKDLGVNAFVVNHIPMEEAEAHLTEKRDILSKIIKNGPDLNEITAN
ncbi:tripartite tricarboxylate transporter substrate-binding protein [Robertmurraya sp.]|jgi:tripartite-type tricarboxylate transporter receptor subunit TctC|uniref:tripartite tricarboxylate transporter substrate-binding protein n=1 Tax=Robertmurraya sp. TaxID=2837525 RepID=UPI003703FE16